MKSFLIILIVLFTSSCVYAQTVKKIDPNTIAITQPDIQLSAKNIYDQETNILERIKQLNAEITLLNGQLSSLRVIEKQMGDLGVTK